MTDDVALPGLELPSKPVVFAPTRDAGLARLGQFVARAGGHYTQKRNYDFGPDKRTNVSSLSPWIRHRLITEVEVLKETLARHGPLRAEKFVQEVFWRGYFKGWLEQRPSVWAHYRQGRNDALEQVQSNQALAADYEAAVAGRTGIDCFDHWARELVETGFLHNHARMWFASIWIFTLRLPWELGADVFLRHLVDGDPASNTLSWRWVGGLHTKGKTYLARHSNIATFTEGRFNPGGRLASTAPPLLEDIEHPCLPFPAADPMPTDDYLLLVTEEDGLLGSQLPRKPVAVLGLLATKERSPRPLGSEAERFARGAIADAMARTEANCGAPADGGWAERIIAAADAAGTQKVVTAFAPVGPVAERLAAVRPALVAAGITLHQVRRRYDDLVWPHAARGFFGLKMKIPQILTALDLRA